MDRTKTTRNSRRERRRCLAQHRRRQLERCAAFEWLPPCDQFVQDDPERPDIAAGVSALPFEHFRRQIAERPRDDASFGQRRGGDCGLYALRQTPGQPEIEHLQPAARGDHEVGALQIAMDDSAGVRVRDRVSELEGQVRDRREREAPFWHTIGQHAAIKKLHGDERTGLVVAHLMHLTNVRMLQFERVVGLTLQPSRGISTGVGQHLDRDAQVRPGVPCFIHLAHATGAHPPAQAIRAASRAAEPAERRHFGRQALDRRGLDEVRGSEMGGQ